MTRVKSAGLAAPRRVAVCRQQRHQLVAAHALAPACERGTVERQGVAKELLAAKQLIIRVFPPTLAQGLIGQIVHVFEDGEPRHQPCRQRRPSRTIAVGGAKALLDEAPVDGPRQLHQRMCEVDDLIKPRP
jgi:hypothetical protein